MKKFILIALMAATTAIAFGQFSATTFIEGNSGRSKVGLSYEPIQTEGFSSGLFAGVNGQSFGDWVQRPNRFGSFGTLSAGPALSVLVWKDRKSPLSLNLT